MAIGQGVLAIADRDNNRVLLYRTTDLGSANPKAAVVVGQADAVSYVPDLDQRTPSAARLSGPAGVALDSTYLIVANTENHRVLVWSPIPTSTGTPANLVLGQADFTGSRPNRGRGDADGDGFFYPTGVASDGTSLFVADRLNNRVLVWNDFPTESGQPADLALGQMDLKGSLANRGGGPFAFVSSGLNLPTGVTVSGNAVWVADTENNRLVQWDMSVTPPAPTAFIGQASGATVSNPNYELAGDPTAPNPGIAQSPAASATATLRPRSVAAAGGTLYVTEMDGNRVHLFDAVTLASKGVLGQASDTGMAANASGVSAGALTVPLGIATDGTKLWVADSGNHRVLGYDVTRASATGTPASAVLGQPSFATNGFNQASTAVGGATSQPGAVAVAGGNLYVADTGNHRVLVFQTPVAPGQAPARVYGQADMLQALANRGGAPSAATLRGPRGVFVDAAHLLVSDTANNRVLVYDPSATSTSAALVLGQPDFATTSGNTGGVGASTMLAPTGAYSDGKSLWVADTGNSRVLVWRTFPTANGQPADLVIGQTSFTGALSNQGGAAATAATLSLPSSVDVVGGVLYVADTGNNRVVSFSTPPTASGASADSVLGQADLATRAPAVDLADLSHLAGPVALTDDGQNLYVSDRDLARVLVYTVATVTQGEAATSVVGSLGGVSLKTPNGIAAERTPFFTTRLYVADTGNNQVAVIRSVNRLSLQ
ncbi:MAG: hypothetical protein JOZ69_16825 [Myxococcales bacterium]|nr:hypothetical protein [Myxococcales bacterium]